MYDKVYDGSAYMQTQGEYSPWVKSVVQEPSKSGDDAALIKVWETRKSIRGRHGLERGLS